MLTIIVFVIEICIEWNKRIFSFKNQCASGWQINIIRWRQRDRASLGSSKDCKGLGGSIQRRWMTSHMLYFTYVCQNFSLKKKQDTIRTGECRGCALVVETSVTVHNNSPTQDYVHPHDQTHPTFEMIPGFKPFTIDSMLRLFSNRSQMTSNCGKNKELVICINSFSGILLKAK